MTRARAIAHVIASVTLACAFAFLALCFIVGLMSIWAFVAFFVVIIAALLWPFTDLEMRPMGNRNSGRGKRITISGGPFTFRTLHPPAETSSKLAAEGTIDKSITLTMPAIDGAEHLVVPNRRIRL